MRPRIAGNSTHGKKSARRDSRYNRMEQVNGDRKDDKRWYCLLVDRVIAAG
jgi:hypothetical protein